VIRLFSNNRFQKITVAVYGLAVVLSAFGILHDHSLLVLKTASAHEIHDSSCVEHTQATGPLSEHCARCQFLLAAKLPSSTSLSVRLLGTSVLSFESGMLRDSHTASVFLRGPPRSF
jgi:hypothetical protein